MSAAERKVPLPARADGAGSGLSENRKAPGQPGGDSNPSQERAAEAARVFAEEEAAWAARPDGEQPSRVATARRLLRLLHGTERIPYVTHHRWLSYFESPTGQFRLYFSERSSEVALSDSLSSAEEAASLVEKELSQELGAAARDRAAEAFDATILRMARARADSEPRDYWRYVIDELRDGDADLDRGDRARLADEIEKAISADERVRSRAFQGLPYRQHKPKPWREALAISALRLLSEVERHCESLYQMEILRLEHTPRRIEAILLDRVEAEALQLKARFEAARRRLIAKLGMHGTEKQMSNKLRTRRRTPQ